MRNVVVVIALFLPSLSFGVEDYLTCQREETMTRMVCLNRLLRWSWDSPQRYRRLLERVDEQFDTHPGDYLRLLMALQNQREKILSEIPQEKWNAYPKVEEQFDFLPHTVHSLWEKGWRSLMIFESAELAASGAPWIVSYWGLRSVPLLNKNWGITILGGLALTIALKPFSDRAVNGMLQDRKEREMEENLLQLERGEGDLRERLALLKKITEDMVQLINFHDDGRSFEEVIIRMERMEIEGAPMYLRNLRHYIQDREMLIESMGE